MTDTQWKLASIQRWEWLLLFSICISCIVYWCLHYHPFVLPNSDFGQIEKTAIQLMAGELPSNYKRMPLFPALVGILGSVISSDDPYLHAGLILNILFSVGVLIVLFILGRMLIGPAAFVPVICLLVMGTFHGFALQPLIEPALTFLIFLSLLLFVRGSNWQYIFAGLAALTRYEAFALIWIIFSLNNFFDRRYILNFSLAIAASTGFIVWMILSINSHDGGNPYLSQIASQNYSLAWSMAGTMLRPVYSNSSWDVFAALLLIVGIGIAFKRFKIPTVAIVLFGFSYLIAHIAFGVDKGKYAYPVCWIVPFYATVAAISLRERYNLLLSNFSKQIVFFLFAIVVVLFAREPIFKAFESLLNNIGLLSKYVYLSFFVCVWIFFISFWYYSSTSKSRLSILQAILFATTLLAIGSQSYIGHVKQTKRAYYAKYQGYLGLKWLEANMEKGERVLVPSTFPMRKTSLPVSGIELFGNMDAENHTELKQELCKKKISYVVYWYRRGKPNKLKKKNYSRDLHYYKSYKFYLAETFETGEPLSGFDHMTTLPLPKIMKKPPVQIYRVNLSDQGCMLNSTTPGKT